MTDWLRPPPTGRPYQQLGRTDVHAWWRPIVGLLAIAVLTTIAGTVFVGVVFALVWFATGEVLRFGRGPEELFTNHLANLIAMIGSIGVLLPIVGVVTLVVERRGIGSLSSTAGRVRWRWLALCFLPAIGYMLAVVGGSYVADAITHRADDPIGDWIGWHAFWPALLVIVLLVPIQATAEEYAFRGWVLQAIGSFTFEDRPGRAGRRLARVFSTPWPAILLAAIPFVAGHAYTDWGLLDIGAFAVVTGWVVVQTGGLEAGIALHIVNNMVGMSLSAAEGDVPLAQGSVPVPDVIVDTVPMLLWAAVIVWMFRHTGSKRPMNRLS
ncbi:MAG TPA: CPBP family intramembrane glutamic endopeptidase [Aeromicrobium sp.]|nr:CPBP family intramembrane glutamic endopeptidase [Aeromicrobium sp.]